jgi:polynucleotide 5'-kinase involved in rRNA processing
VEIDPYASLRERVIGEHGVVMLIGAPDTGKTTLSKLLIADALSAGRKVAFVDGDVGVPTVGPPACVGLKWIRSRDDLAALAHEDDLRFVGSLQPDGAVLQHVVASADLVGVARREADFIVLDTTGAVSGVVSQTLDYHLMELCNPAVVIAMQRGSELEPTVGMLKRFLGARVARAQPPADLVPAGPVEARERRITAFREALRAPLQQWRIQPTVFAPTLPEEFDLEKLAGMLVGVQDGSGRCLGLGIVEHEDGVLRVATRHGEEMKGLRLGSLRIDPETFDTSRVWLRQLIFGV